MEKELDKTKLSDNITRILTDIVELKNIMKAKVDASTIPTDREKEKFAMAFNFFIGNIHHLLLMWRLKEQELEKKEDNL